MPLEHGPADCLTAILDNIADIEDYTAGLERDAFEQDGLTRDAVKRCIQRVCTALSRLGECAPALVSDQPWGDLLGVGDQLRRSSNPIAEDIVWTVVERDLQALKLSAALTLDRLKSDVDDG